ncbi:hypothetical protein EMIT0P395_350001 [Pseudomonas sp. IT-P395]
MLFAGKGRQGVGVLVDPFNPDKVWKAEIPVDTEWESVPDHAMPLGGNWCRFRQTLTDNVSEATYSDWIESPRFEIEQVAVNKIRSSKQVF